MCLFIDNCFEHKNLEEFIIMSYKNINPMLVAIDEAEKAGLRDEVPVGAAIYDHEHGHIAVSYTHLTLPTICSV